MATESINDSYSMFMLEIVRMQPFVLANLGPENQF